MLYHISSLLFINWCSHAFPFLWVVFSTLCSLVMKHKDLDVLQRTDRNSTPQCIICVLLFFAPYGDMDKALFQTRGIKWQQFQLEFSMVILGLNLLIFPYLFTCTCSSLESWNSTWKIELPPIFTYKAL